MNPFAHLIEPLETRPGVVVKDGERVKRHREYEAKRKREDALPSIANPWKLTPTQCAVLSGLAEGLSNNKVAERLCISFKTTSTHLTRARELMNAENVVHAVVLWDRFARGVAA